MEPSTKTIRDELQAYLHKENLLVYQFAEKSGINSGTLSKIINAIQPIPLSILDQMTAEMGLEEGFFYDQYVTECLHWAAPDWRRLGPLIVRCAELDKLDCIRKIAGTMLENLNYLSPLFEMAESLYDKGLSSAALILYYKVAETEKYQHSERLAVCQYRIFRLSLNQDQKNNMKRAAQFEPYSMRLQESEQLEALKELTDIYFSLKQWEKARELAKELRRLGDILYKEKHERINRNKPENSTDRQLFGYILYSHLIIGSIYEENGQYDKALQHVSHYEDHSWIVEVNAEAESSKIIFKKWAKANRYLYRIMSGEIGLIAEYIEYISAQPDEVMKAMFKIIKVANLYGVNINTILDRFDSEIQSQIELGGRVIAYNDAIIQVQFCEFLADLAKYYFNQGIYRIGMKYTLESFAISNKINNAKCMMRCVGLFETNRHLTVASEIETYKAIVEEAYGKNEKENDDINTTD